MQHDHFYPAQLPPLVLEPPFEGPKYTLPSLALWQLRKKHLDSFECTKILKFYRASPQVLQVNFPPGEPAASPAQIRLHPGFGQISHFIRSQLEFSRMTDDPTDWFRAEPVVAFVLKHLAKDTKPAHPVIFCWKVPGERLPPAILVFLDINMVSRSYTPQELIALRGHQFSTKLFERAQADHEIAEIVRCNDEMVAILAAQANRNFGQSTINMRDNGPPAPPGHPGPPASLAPSVVPASRIPCGPSGPTPLGPETSSEHDQDPASWKYRGRMSPDATIVHQPVPAPSGLCAQKDEGFQKFYRAVVSPTHVRVTAGGRIVPNTRHPGSPTSKWNKDNKPQPGPDTSGSSPCGINPNHMGSGARDDREGRDGSHQMMAPAPGQSDMPACFFGPHFPGHYPGFPFYGQLGGGVPGMGAMPNMPGIGNMASMSNMGGMGNMPMGGMGNMSNMGGMPGMGNMGGMPGMGNMGGMPGMPGMPGMVPGGGGGGGMNLVPIPMGYGMYGGFAFPPPFAGYGQTPAAAGPARPIALTAPQQGQGGDKNNNMRPGSEGPGFQNPTVHRGSFQQQHQSDQAHDSNSARNGPNGPWVMRVPGSGSARPANAHTAPVPAPAPGHRNASQPAANFHRQGAAAAQPGLAVVDHGSQQSSSSSSATYRRDPNGAGADKASKTLHSSIRQSEITRNQIKSMRSSLKYLEDQLQYNKHQIDEKSTETEAQHFRRFIQEFEVILEQQVGSEDVPAGAKQDDQTNVTVEGAAVPTHSAKPVSRLSPSENQTGVDKGSSLNRAEGGPHKSAVAVTTPGIGGGVSGPPGPPGLPGHGGPGGLVAPCGAQTTYPRGVDNGPSHGQNMQQQQQQQPSRPSSTLPSNAALAPPFHPGVSNSITYAKSRSEAVTSSEGGEDDAKKNSAGTSSRAGSNAEWDRIAKAQGLPYLVGRVPPGVDPGMVKDADYIYPRQLTDGEKRARHLYWGDAPAHVRRGLPKYDGKNFYPPSPVRGSDKSRTSKESATTSTEGGALQSSASSGNASAAAIEPAQKEESKEPIKYFVPTLSPQKGLSASEDNAAPVKKSPKGSSHSEGLSLGPRWTDHREIFDALRSKRSPVLGAALPGTISSMTAVGYLPQYKGHAAASLTPVMAGVPVVVAKPVDPESPAPVSTASADQRGENLAPATPTEATQPEATGANESTD